MCEGPRDSQGHCTLWSQSRLRQEVRGRPQVPKVKWHLHKAGQSPHKTGHLCSGRNQRGPRRTEVVPRRCHLQPRPSGEHRLYCRLPLVGSIKETLSSVGNTTHTHNLNIIWGSLWLNPAESQLREAHTGKEFKRNLNLSLGLLKNMKVCPSHNLQQHSSKSLYFPPSSSCTP